MTAKEKSKLISRKLRRQNKKAMQSVGEHFDTHLVDQFTKIRHVKRPVISWILLVFFLSIGVFIQTRQLSAYYIDDVPISGGVLKEGMVGEVTNFNPLYITSNADSSLSELIFSSLVKYDGEGEVIGDLAKRWTANSAGTQWTFELRDDAFWHDGEQVTADDVVFTFDMLQHPDSGSPLLSSWRGVKVEKDDDYKVTFKLPNAFTPLPDSLTGVGIIPEHVLSNVTAEQLRGHKFNLIEPIGSGPFIYSDSVSLEGRGEEDVTLRFRLLSHRKYHLGQPRLNGLTLFVYSDREKMVNAFNEGELGLAGGLVATDIDTSAFIEQKEDEEGEPTPDRSTVVLDTANIQTVPRTAGVFLFLNNSDPLFKDAAVREAVALATDRGQIVELSDGFYFNLKGPLLSSHLGYSAKKLQPNRNVAEAAKVLKDAKWILNQEEGVRYKGDVKLEFTVISQADDIFPEALSVLQESLLEVGIAVNANIISSERIQQDFIAEHQYQALLFGIEMGHDADQFAFWHSSQSGLNGRNLSNYNSTTADLALESGRTRVDEELREAKYSTFVSRWVADNPAVALYQPSYTYTNRKQVKGVDIELIDKSSDRYHNVHRWTINVGQAEKPY